jgi:hypothetical protein
VQVLAGGKPAMHSYNTQQQRLMVALPEKQGDLVHIVTIIV